MSVSNAPGRSPGRSPARPPGRPLGRVVVALRPATVQHQTLWGRASADAPEEAVQLWHREGSAHARDEVAQIGPVRLPQARETFAVTACRVEARWGVEHGLNEHQLAAGYLPLHSRFRLDRPGLQPADLVRLALERCRNVEQAIELLAQLIPEFSQGDPDASFLLADPLEAAVLETAGRHWALQSVREVRALAEMPTIRQDWDRVSTGLGGLAIERGWWPDDGRKVDFAGVVSGTTHERALRDWGRTTLRLEQGNGVIDRPFVREVLAEGPAGIRMIAELSAEPRRLPIAWFWIGGPRHGVYLPLFADGDIPDKLACSKELSAIVQQLTPDTSQGQSAWLEERLADLQARLDQDADAFATEGAALRLTGEEDDRRRLATLFMEHAVERFLDCLPGASLPTQRVMTSTVAAEWSW